MHKVFSLFLLATLLFFFTPSGMGSNSAQASIYAGSNAGWLVVSSHSQQNVAIQTARQYAGRFPTTVVFRSTNGYFGVSIGWTNSRNGKSTIRNLVANGYIPSDSYIHNGKRWVQAVWSANNSHSSGQRRFLSASRLGAVQNSQAPVQPKPTPVPPQVLPLQPTAALVNGVAGGKDKYLSLRQGPGTSFAEIVRMREETPLTITGKSKSWYRVKLNNGVTGFAYSKYVRIADIPTVGPDRTPIKEVPVVGPVKSPNPTNELVNNPVPKEPKVITPPKRNEDAIKTDQKRVALVLGNSKYEHTTALANPKNDADAIGTKLEKLGFTVIKGLDLSKAGMELAIRDFVRELPGSDVALFFYAGHAMQVNGTNYLIPVNAALEDSTAIDFETINFNVILNFMNGDNRTSIALLDACRNNPLARNFTRKLSKARSAFVGRGLAVPTSGEGELLIGFATSPDQVALDGEGKNSPFTKALLRHMETPNLEIELMLKRVKADVYEETEGNQSPWNNSALRKEFYFSK